MARCEKCKKKLPSTMLSIYTCRCKGKYCSTHLQDHDCTFDYANLQKKQLQKDLSRVDGTKLIKV